MVREDGERRSASGGDRSGSLLITGGSGALGRTYLAEGRWNGRIIVYARGEEKIEALRPLLTGTNTRLYIGDIRDPERLRIAMRGVDTVLHLAALKVVPGGGWNPDEMMLTNCVGTMNVLRAAIDCGVRRVLVVTTDKGVLPTTYYGATKLIKEHLACVMNDWSETKISAVRFGNLIGSTGSFTHAIANWKKGDPPLPITDEEMTRFWLPMDSAVAFIDFVLDKMEGGEIFVMKPPSKRIIDLLPMHTEWKVVGLRPTEKVHETLIGAHEHGIDHGKYVIIYPYGSGDYPALGTLTSGPSASASKTRKPATPRKVEPQAK